MYSIFFRPLIVLFALVFFVPVDFFISSAWSEGSLPSQKERFSGMSSTFKEKKKQISAAKNQQKSDQEQSPDEEDNKPLAANISYFKLHTFVVNIQDNRQPDKLVTLTLEIFCEINNSDDKWLIDTHIAPIKDSIITHVSGIERERIQTQKQKIDLQQELTDRVSSVLKNLTGQKVINGLYITRFIIQ